MRKSPLRDLVIRTAVVRQPDMGNILACDLKKEDQEVQHAYMFKWQAGEFIESAANFDAHSLCAISSPEPALIFIAASGAYGVHYREGSLAGNILENTEGFRSVSEIAGQAYATGYGGIVCRLDELRKWTRIDKGLPDSLSIEAVHGFNASDIYAAGLHGEFWHYDGNRWAKRELPTNQNLTTVKCVGDGKVYIAGHGGILIRGEKGVWTIISHDQMQDDIWDLEWFEGHLYVSTPHNVYRLNGERLEPVDFGKDRPKSCYQLSSAPGVLWSNGEHDIMSFDGRSWARVV